MKLRFLCGVVIVGILVALVVWRYGYPEEKGGGKNVDAVHLIALGDSSLREVLPLPAKEESISDKDREAIGKELKRWGLQEKPSAQKYLDDAVIAGDKGQASRGFHEVIYSGNWKMSEVVPVLKSFLNNADAFIRYKAAEKLFVVGDRSAYSVLLELVQLDKSVEGIGEDIRIQAARTLARYRETDAAQSIYDLYEKTKDGELITALTKMQAKQAGALVEMRGFFAESSAMKYYVLNESVNFIPQITSVFKESTKPEVKVAAAWALSSMRRDPLAIDYLLQQANFALTNSSALSESPDVLLKYKAGVDAIKYLGVIESPAAKRMLEAALDCSDTQVVQVAVVNLLYNQGGSDRAIKVIADQLNDSVNARLPWEFTLNVASQLGDNPQIQTAGQNFAQKSQDRSWQLHSVERKEWSIYNWVDEYVLRLNRRP
jgi:hypothetical protein